MLLDTEVNFTNDRTYSKEKREKERGWVEKDKKYPGRKFHPIKKKRRRERGGREKVRVLSLVIGKRYIS